MKNTLVKQLRRLLPAAMIHTLEEAYRRSRIALVAARYGNPARHLRVIAVTGTNGKTTTVNYINEILKAGGRRTAMFSTALIEVAGQRQLNDLNATVGSTARMQQFFAEAKRANVDFVVLEITSHALDQHKLDGVPIEVAVMTNLTQDHLDYHKTMERYAAAKGKLFARKPRFIVLNRDDEWFPFFDKYMAREQKITYGQDAAATARITQAETRKVGGSVTVLLDGVTKLPLTTHLPGVFNIYNMTAAAAACQLLGVAPENIAQGVANLTGVPGRFERVPVDTSYDVIVDYAHTPDALEKLLTSARAITKQRIILVFGATGDRDKAKRPIMGEIAARLADQIIVTDEESYNEEPAGIRQAILRGIHQAGGAGHTKEIADRREAIAQALAIAQAGDTILITGMGHEQFRIINGQRQPWNDAAVVRSLVAKHKQ